MLSVKRQVVATALAATFAWVAIAVGAAPVAAQHADCATGVAEGYLDVNNVRARIVNTGALFWRGNPFVYEVPKGGGIHAVFTQSLWIAGLVDGQLRAAASRYGNYEFWPGPLDETTILPPRDCADFDRIWNVRQSDVADYEAGMRPADDLRDWPTGLGAPTVDAAGREIDVMAEPLAQRLGRTIDLDAGERPLFTGDQMLWWVMNDAGNVHNETETPRIGIEVQVTAFAFDRTGPANETTFYRYRVFYRGTSPLDSAYVGVFQDVDLGNYDDDYVGTDTTLGLAFAYNADNDDEGLNGYGLAPPAEGFDFVRGPTVDSAPDTAWVGAERVAGSRNLQLTNSLFYDGAGGDFGDPGIGSDYYLYMQSRWKTGRPMTVGGSGTIEGRTPAKFVFPGDPVTGAFWSEYNTDVRGRPNPPADRRFVASSGPFSMQPGEMQEIIVALLWARGASNLQSIVELRRASRAMQAFADANFEDPPTTLTAPHLAITPYDGALALSWSGTSVDQTRLEAFKQYVPSLNATYAFEGYDIFEYRSREDTVGVRVAAYDIRNGVTRVVDTPPGGLTELAALGSDRGVQHTHYATGLVNYRTYCFGVQAYAFQNEYYPRVLRSPVSRACAEPRKSAVPSNLPTGSDAAPDTIRAVQVAGSSDGVVYATAVNPASVTGDTYFVNFVDRPCTPLESTQSTESAQTVCVAYEIVGDDGATVLGAQLSTPPAYGERLFYHNGLEFSIRRPAEVPDSLAVFSPGDSFSINTAPFAPRIRSVEEAVEALDTIGIIPNPYFGLSAYAVSKGSHDARFTNVPPGAIIRVFTLSGTLIRTIRTEAGATPTWDLRNKAGLTIGGGLYLIHVEVPDVGTRILKFSVTPSRTK